MEDDLARQLSLHTAGATVQHQSPFAGLPSWHNAAPLPPEFINQWVKPFYGRIGETSPNWAARLRAVRPAISAGVTGQLLGDFNWRTRQTGAFFAALTGDAQWLDVIGTHLLKSEVCYAGQVYAIVLAAFNTPACVGYLNRYLTYYLSQPALWFDQRIVLEALLYLDEVNGTALTQVHQMDWLNFTKDKPHWDKQIFAEQVRLQVNFMRNLT